jgi:hypothetical protein
MAQPFRRRLLPLLFSLLGTLVGCQDIGLPHLFDPSSASQKVAEATKYDPYPDPTLGPDITGARPRGFLNPRPDPDASKLQIKGPWPPAGPTANYPPPAYPAAAPVYAAPPNAYAPGTAVYPAAPVGTSLPAAPQAAAPIYLPSGAVSPAPATTLYGSAPPVAYGKAIGSP